MRLAIIIILILFLNQLNAQISQEMIPVTRQNPSSHKEMIKQMVKYNNHLLTGLDSVIVYRNNQLVDKLAIKDIRIQVSDNERIQKLDSVVSKNTIEFYRGDKLIKKKIFNKRKELLELTEYESNQINRKTTYKYNKKNLILEQTYEYWSESPKASLEKEIKFSYQKGKLKTVSQKVIRPINKSYTIFIKSYDINNNITSLQTKMYSSDDEVFMEKTIAFIIEPKTNTLTKIKAKSKDNIDAIIDYKDKNILMKINY